MTNQPAAPLSAEREQEIRDSIPTAYGPPWTLQPDMEDSTWRVMYATDHPLAGLVCEVPDYGAHLAEFIAEARAAVPELLAEVDRLRAAADRVRALAILEAADFLRTAHFNDGLSVQEIGTALRHTVDEADPMIGSLARDGFDADEIADVLSRPTAAAAEKPAACGKCKTPFDPADTRHDGHAREGITSFCRRCVDRCHESTDAFHVCAVCREGGE